MPIQVVNAPTEEIAYRLAEVLENAYYDCVNTDFNGPRVHYHVTTDSTAADLVIGCEWRDEHGEDQELWIFAPLAP